MKTKNTRLYQLLACLWLILFGFINTLKAGPVDVEKAKSVAFKQLQKVTGDISLRSAASLDLVYEPKNDSNQPYFYVFNGNKGFVIVSGDDRVAPVLGYSDDGYFDPNNIPPNMAEFLQGYQKEIDYVMNNDTKMTTKFEQKTLLSDNPVRLKSYNEGSSLISTAWKQGDLYNDSCPSINGEKSYVGCGGVAMAQIICYWGRDRKMTVNHGFKIFKGIRYNYDIMPNSLSIFSSDEERGAVAQLMYHCGVASGTAWSLTGSSTTMTKVCIGLRDEFGYSNAMPEKAKSIDEMINILRREIDSLRPVIYSGGRHIWVCDGYKYEDDGIKFHMSWGWGSNHNGYYVLSPISIPDQSLYAVFSSDTEAITHIYPVKTKDIVFVNPQGGRMCQDGSSWDCATSDLYGEMKKNREIPTQIWVQYGMYYGDPTATLEDDASFIIGKNCEVYGSFSGNEYSLENRNIIYPSYLDGQRGRRVLRISERLEETDTAYIDGFQLQKGNPNFKGGTVYIDKNVIFNNCSFSLYNNGIYNEGSVRLSNCDMYYDNTYNTRGYCISNNGNLAIEGSSKIIGGSIYLNGDSAGCIKIDNLTYHTDSTKPIYMHINEEPYYIAKYNTDEEANVAFMNGLFVIENQSDKNIVAQKNYIKMEAYTPPPGLDHVVYVTPEGAGNKDGSSWENATSDLYSEMMKNRTDTIQIWVKEGMYYGNTSVGQGGNLAAFILGKRNKGYGGFVGNESSLPARAQHNLSVLDGQNSRRVLCQLADFADVDSSFIDGFILQNGVDTIVGTANVEMSTGGQSIHNGGTDMTGNGGGVYLRRNGILRNCTIENCAARSGGGVFNYGGKLIDCSFINNEAEHAGGLFNRGTTSLANCTIFNNRAISRIGYGGGIYNMGTLSIFDEVLIDSNKATAGAGIYTYSTCTTIMNGGVMSRNTATFGGGIYNDGIVVVNNGEISHNFGNGIVNHGKLTLNSGMISYNTYGSGGGIMNGGDLWINSTSVKIQSNNAGMWGIGGGLYTYGNAYISGVTIGASTSKYPESQEEALSIGGNIAQMGGGIYVDNGKNFIIGNMDSVIISGNYSTYQGGGIYTRASSIFPSNVMITGNASSHSGGGLFVVEGQITLEGCHISYNKSGSAGGGISQSGKFFINPGTKIENNETHGDGGGIEMGGSVYMTGGTISGNKAHNRGGAIFNIGSALSIDGGEIVNNEANIGDGIHNNRANFSLRKSVNIKDIIYIPSASYAVNLGDNLTYHTDNTKPITIQGGIGYTVAASSLAQSYVTQGIVASTPGLRPIASGNNIYLQNDGTRSMELNSITDNGNIGVEELAVYPTLLASGGTLTIESPNGGNASIWNVSGVLVGQYPLENGKTQIPAPNLSGHYIVKVKAASGEEKTVKIVVK